MSLKSVKDNLFKTKNNSKILALYNQLSTSDKQKFLSDDNVINRIQKFRDINLLFMLLFSLPHEFRIAFLSKLDKSVYNSEYDRVLLQYLMLPNYDEFDFAKVIDIIKSQDNQIISVILRNFSSMKLLNIIKSYYNQHISDAAFVELSKKNNSLELDSNLLSFITDAALFLELKRRKTRKQHLYFDASDFFNLAESRQNTILVNGNIENIEKELFKQDKDALKGLSSDELRDMFSELLNKFSYINLIKIQAIICELDDEEALPLIKEFFSKVLKFECEVIDRYLNSMLYYFRQQSESTDTIYHLTKLKPFAVIYFLNTGVMDENINNSLSQSITLEQYQKLSIKKVKNIVKLIESLKRNKKQDISQSSMQIFAYKMYLVFGYEIALELLNQKFGCFDYDTICKLLCNCSVLEAKVSQVGKSYEPVINPYFIQFFFGDKKDNNSTMRKMLQGELDIVMKSFWNVYGNFERFQHHLGNVIHLNRLIPLLKWDSLLLLPDEYKLTPDLIKDIIRSYKYVDVLNNIDASKVDNAKVIKMACSFYHNYLEKRVLSAIPRVSGVTSSGYRYEVLKLDDPLIMTLGYYTRCCFRLNGESKEFLRYCSESPYARVIVIRNENSAICGVVPIIRNGNALVGNSIETNKNGDDSEIYTALQAAYNDILRVSIENENDPMIIGLVTNLHNECKSKVSIDYSIMPIWEAEFYTNMNKKQYIVSIEQGKTESDIRLFEPTPIYYDERPEVLVYYRGSKDIAIQEEVNKRVNAVAYKAGQFGEKYLRIADIIICSEDWFLVDGFVGIIGECVAKDFRGVEEYRAVKSYLERVQENSESRFYQIDEADLQKRCLTPKKLMVDKKQISEMKKD